MKPDQVIQVKYFLCVYSLDFTGGKRGNITSLAVYPGALSVHWRRRSQYPEAYAATLVAEFSVVSVVFSRGFISYLWQLVLVIIIKGQTLVIFATSFTHTYWQFKFNSRAVVIQASAALSTDPP